MAFSESHVEYEDGDGETEINETSVCIVEVMDEYSSYDCTAELAKGSREYVDCTT